MFENYQEGVKRHIADTLVHKQFFITSTMKMINYLYECDRYDDAVELAKRCSMHDHSKFEMDEVEMFIKMPVDEHPNGILTEEQRELIALHWKRNRHHPEFFTSVTSMSDMDIMEMVVDWHARSQQFGTNFDEFVQTIGRTRFGFDLDMFTRVVEYCDIMNS